ncbi:MAG: hypothetical protein GXO58_04990 [Thermodesulfobacteria bacterium]|nr:hypothetical protein [Thermodesulfobacteriota bacterium]
MDSLKALLYPRCYLKRKTGDLLSPFFKELIVMAPSEKDKEKIESITSKLISSEVKAWLPSPLGDKADELQAGISALTQWGEQLGLGERLSFETLYSAITASQDSEVQSIMDALKGHDQEDVLMAARAFLALSLEADKREDELEAEIEKVEERARRISQLVEDASLLPQNERPVFFIQPLSKARERLRAWVRLAFSAEKLPQAWPVGESIIIKDMLDTAYESVTKGKIPKDLFTIYMPLDETLLRNEDLIYKARGIFKDLLRVLEGTCSRSAEDFDSDSEFKELVDALSSTLESKKWEQLGAPRLIFTFYEGAAWARLMVAAAKLSDDEIKLPGDHEKLCASFFIV